MRDRLRAVCGTDVTVGERLEGGYANDLFRVTAGGRELVLRILHEERAPEDVAWEHELTCRLAAALEFVHAPLPPFELDGRTAWLMPFVAGAPAAGPDRLAVAAAIGRLHAAAPDMAQRPGRPDGAWPEPYVLDGVDLAPLRVAALRTVAAAADRYPRTGVIHGDLFPGNVLTAGGAVTAVLDWDEAHVDWLVWDLAIAVGTFCPDGDDAARDAFVAAYRDAGGLLPPEEDDLLVPLVRAKRTLELLRAPADRDPRWDFQRRNLASLP